MKRPLCILEAILSLITRRTQVFVEWAAPINTNSYVFVAEMNPYRFAITVETRGHHLDAGAAPEAYRPHEQHRQAAEAIRMGEAPGGAAGLLAPQHARDCHGAGGAVGRLLATSSGRRATV